MKMALTATQLSVSRSGFTIYFCISLYTRKCIYLLKYIYTGCIHISKDAMFKICALLCYSIMCNRSDI